MKINPLILKIILISYSNQNQEPKEFIKSHFNDIFNENEKYILEKMIKIKNYAKD